MKIIQINGWLGRLNGPLARFISEQNADIVCMQEAYKPNPDVLPALADQYNFLQEVIDVGGYRYTSFADCWAMKLSGATIIEGNVILSRFPIRNEYFEHTNGKYHVRSVPSDTISNTRIWQSCTVNIGEGIKITVANYHGYLSGQNPLGDDTTVLTMSKVAAFVDELARPLIICGDFNITPESLAIRLLDGKGLVNHTIKNSVTTTLSPAHRVALPYRDSVACDYIFTSQDIEVADFTVSDALVSDHKALILNFSI